jgi:hypothetical protein
MASHETTVYEIPGIKLYTKQGDPNTLRVRTQFYCFPFREILPSTEEGRTLCKRLGPDIISICETFADLTDEEREERLHAAILQDVYTQSSRTRA